MSKKLHKTLLCATLLAVGVSMPVTAETHRGEIENVVSAELLPGWRSDAGAHVAAIKLTLQPGWKTYWRAAGDGGIPTQIGFDGSENLGSARIVWPHPQVFFDHGARSIGYRGAVVLPLKINPQGDGPITLRADLRFGVCDEVCLPVQMTLRHTLEVAADGPDPAIDLALRDTPQANAGAVACSFDGDGVISVRFSAPPLAGEALVIEPANPLQWIGEPEMYRDGNSVMAKAQMDLGDTPLDQSALRFTMIGTQGWVEMAGCD